MKMSKVLLMMLVLFLALSPATASAVALIPGESCTLFPVEEEVIVVRIYYKSLQDYKLLAGYDIFEFNNTVEKYYLAAVVPSQILTLEKLGFKVKVDDQETANFQLLSQVKDARIETIPGYDCYRTVEETFAAAAALATNYPHLAEWIDVGDSWEKSVGQSDGYDMMVLRLTNETITGTKPKLFITASIHAREYTPAELATRFAEYLVDNYGSDPDVTWILDYHEVHLMLMANPDGRKEAEAGTSWRKNTNENYCRWSAYRGADLNRNFNFEWGEWGGSSSYECDSTYRGPSAASEPETQSIQAYLQSIFPDQRDESSFNNPAPLDATGIYIDLHSYSELVLWSWGFMATDAPNHTQLQTLGRKFAYFNDYTPQKAYSLYPTDGTTDDYGYGRLGVASYTLELGTAFFQNCTTFESTIYPDNLNALLYAAKAVRTPYMTPKGPDTLDLSLTPYNIAIGVPVTLSATIDDTRYRSGTGEPTQGIQAVEYYIDTPPWVDGAVPHPIRITNTDLSTNSADVSVLIDTSEFTSDKHVLFVRGQDADGNWGPVSAVFLYTWDPLSANLISFSGSYQNGAVHLEWETSNEIDNLGFNLYRSNAADGDRIKLNDDLIPTLVPPGSAFGAFYTYDDVLSLPDNYYYWLESVDISGNSTLHNPIAVVVK